MGRRKRERLSEGKKNIITGLINEYNIQSAQDIQDALKDLLGETIKEMMETEMDHHLGYENYQRSENTNSRNGYKPKTVRSHYGEVKLEVPQDRESSFEPRIVRKRQKDIFSVRHSLRADKSCSSSACRGPKNFPPSTFLPLNLQARRYAHRGMRA